MTPSPATQRRILVCGSRNYQDDKAIERVLSEYAGPGVTVMHGNAPGADVRAGEIAYWLGCRVIPFTANWGKYGTAAGPIRNRQMLDEKPDLVIAFAGGKGTTDTVREAKRRGIPVRQVA